MTPNANNTSTHYYKGFYWCINSRGTLYTLPFDGQMLQGKLIETYVRLGRLKTINWSSTFISGGKKVPGLILGVSPDEGKAEPLAAAGGDDSFDAKEDGPTYYLLDENQFFDFSDHLSDDFIVLVVRVGASVLVMHVGARVLALSSLCQERLRDAAARSAFIRRLIVLLLDIRIHLGWSTRCIVG